MTAPDAGTPDPVLHATIAAAVERAFRDTQRVLLHEIAGEVADAVIAAATGRLLPPDAKPREQWAVRKSCALEGESVGLPMRTRENAEREVAYLARIDATRSTYGVRGEVVRREVRNFPDGSILVGPWLPAPTEEPA